MSKDIKSRGRKKNVTSGGGNVYKKGSANTGKPVGSNSTYSKKRPSTSKPYTSTGQSSSSSGTRSTGGMSLKQLIILGIVIFVGYQLLKSCGIISPDTMDTSQIDFGSMTESTTNTTSSDQSLSQGDLDTSVSSLARDKYTKIQGNGQDEFTIMIYMCGSDLESRSGMATADLKEILGADISDNLNIIVETGGARSWQNSVVSASTNQRYQLTSEGMKRLEDNMGKRTMTDPNTLVDFIRYSKNNFPANRYALIFWDHGGGSNQGFGHDEFSAGTTMTLDEIDEALTSANVKFDFVGFDACLMATYETAIMLDKHADYLIASEETEPGIGWYYTNWVDELSSDTSMSTLNIGKNIIDDFTEACAQRNPMEKTTLSLIDISELSQTAPEKFKSFAMSTADIIESQEYQEVAEARVGAREFGAQGRLDQIDLIHFAQNLGTAEANELVEAIDQSVKYNRSSRTVPNANGLSIYFPYQRMSEVGSMLNTYDEIGMDEEYSNCIKTFANLELGGQSISSGSSSPLDVLLGSMGQSSPVQPTEIIGGDMTGDLVGTLLTSFLANGGLESVMGAVTSDSSWVDKDAIVENTEFYDNNRLQATDIALTEKNGGYVLSMSDEKWDLVQTLCLNVFVDDGEGFIDLGLDNVYDFDDDGDLIIDYDNTWIAINGQVASYYLVTEEDINGEYIITGRIPCRLNGELVNLMLIFTENNPNGEVLGAQYLYEDSPTSLAKGLLELKDGDTIDFICDYYTYDEQYQDSYYLGEQIVVNGDLFISNVDIGNLSSVVSYQLTDIYNNTYWTPALNFN